ncbi:MAG: phycobiliprotein lyase [Cyanobacteria bacterium P01_E01_bin.34]
MSEFHQFFEHCIGRWISERTYHYLSQQQIERSHTEFYVDPVPMAAKHKVIADNGYATPPDLETMPSFQIGFETVSEHGEKAAHSLNALFVRQSEQTGGVINGDYLRDRAYEEARPMVAQFRFTPHNRELLMTTTYTRVVAVDSITLVTPTLRIRKIVNYLRPSEGEPLTDVVLVGFGVEQKQQ